MILLHKKILIMSIKNNYIVNVWNYAQSHYIKRFKKTYKLTWDRTIKIIKISLSHLDNFLLTTKAEIISSCDKWNIIKCEFNIVWLNISPHASWNRYIVYHDKITWEIMILLLYSKTDVKWNTETVRWKQEIKNNYDFIKKIFSNL